MPQEVEIVYTPTMQDYLHEVRRHLKSRTRDPLWKLRWRVYLHAMGALIFVVGVAIAAHHRRIPAGFLIVFAGLVIGQARAAWLLHKQCRSIQAKMVRNSRAGETVVLRVSLTGLTFIRVGESETAFNWTAVRGVNIADDALRIHYLNGGTSWIPTRFISAEQRVALTEIFAAIAERYGD